MFLVGLILFGFAMAGYGALGSALLIMGRYDAAGH